MKVLIDKNIPKLDNVLSQKYDVTTFEGRDLNNETLRDINPELLIVRSTTKINEELLNNTNIQFVATATAGTDNLDKEYLENKNIQWANAGGSNSVSVAEYTILSILKWKYEKDNQPKSIIGYGEIGSKVGKIASFLGIKINIYDPYLEDDDITNINEFILYKSLNELIVDSQIISMHVPFEEEGDFPTKFMLNKDNIPLIKENSLFINAGRGNTVDDKALLKHSQINNITTVIDVWENEPEINIDLAEYSYISTPHIAGHSYEGKLKGTLMMCKEIEKFTGDKFDKSIIHDELNKSPKYSISEFNSRTLYESLKENIRIEKTDNELRKILNNFTPKAFENLRKQYPKHNETLAIS